MILFSQNFVIVILDVCFYSVHSKDSYMSYLLILTYKYTIIKTLLLYIYRLFSVQHKI